MTGINWLGQFTRRTIYLDDYTDEIMPCDGTPEGWAKWLLQDDETWGHKAAKIGDQFAAHSATVTYHVADLDADGVPEFSPPLPPAASMVVPTYGFGLGWDAMDICSMPLEGDDLAQCVDQINDEEVQGFACLSGVIYGLRCELITHEGVATLKLIEAHL